ncbi:MAG: hypothetical protein MK212_04285, partial [Saprospiraceae bacterium]|nr:hypothetical protein [Saprospiraceae bacterium]
TDSFPLYFAFLAISVGVASFLNSQLVLKYGTIRMVKFCIINLVAISALSWIILYNLELKIPLWGTMTYLIITLFWIGFLFSNLNSLAMEPLGHIAGTGSAIVGAVSTLLGVAIGTAISLQYDGSLVPLAMGFSIFGTISLAMIFWVERTKRNLNKGV